MSEKVDPMRLRREPRSRTPRASLRADFKTDGVQVKRVLKRSIGPKWQFRLHRLGRLRWLTKYRLMRGFNADIGLRDRLAYLLLDPEIESFSFELANEQEVIAGIAAALGCPHDELVYYAAETHSDPELGELLARHVGWRFDVKRRQPLGNRLAWYLMARARKPELIVETGIYLGLGSLVLLRALERNRLEGSPGELMSFDINPHAGVLVRDELRRDWRRLIGSTRELLVPALEGRCVGMVFQDTPHTEENQRLEFGAALSNAAAKLVLVDGSGGGSPVLESLCTEREGSYHRVALRSRDHIYPGADIRFATFQNVQNQVRRLEVGMGQPSRLTFAPARASTLSSPSTPST